MNCMLILCALQELLNKWLALSVDKVAHCCHRELQQLLEEERRKEKALQRLNRPSMQTQEEVQDSPRLPCMIHW